MSELQKQTNPVKSFFQSDAVQSKFKELMGKQATAFITSVLQVVNSNDLLKAADPTSIFTAAATAATLGLPISNQLGFAYIVPYKNNRNGSVLAQFQLGYKGFIQLAQRSGQFQTIAATVIHDNQLISQNPLTGFEFDFTKSPSGKIIGYAAYFRLLNGFEKTLYMTKEEMVSHAKKYSKSYDSASSIWKNDPDSMSIKTVIKLLLSKYAPLSVDMQRAVISDQAVINNLDNIDVTYIDNQLDEPVDKEAERVEKMIQAATTEAELDNLRPFLKEGQQDLFDQKAIEILSK
jgi:recombination protein RecT